VRALMGLWDISAGELERIPVKWNGHSHHSHSPLSLAAKLPALPFAGKDAGTPQRLGYLITRFHPKSASADFGIY
jgi:hypothetical protein